MSKHTFRAAVERRRVIAIPLKKKNEEDPQLYRFKKLKPIGSRI